MNVDWYASEPHYAAHLRPIFDALAPEIRGRRVDDVDHPVFGNATMVASWRDMNSLRGQTQFIYVEHGAGQSYCGDEKSAHWPDYSGAGGLRFFDTLGVISPSERVADLFRARGHKAVAVGCPMLDEHHNSKTWKNPVKGRVTFCFHWPCAVAPEAGTAYEHYANDLPRITARLRAEGFDPCFTRHPKWTGNIDNWLRFDCGLRAMTAEHSLMSTELLIVDNSSLMYETAALGRSVLALNAPWYRRDVHHGLRFWDTVPGWQINEPEELMTVDYDGVILGGLGEMLRAEAVERVYAHNDGSSSRRAAEAILGWVLG